MYVFFQKSIHALRIQNHNNSVIDGDKKITCLTVGVYYEALCPDSRNFILQHLVPSFNKAPYNFDIEFVPYGKAKVRILNNN